MTGRPRPRLIELFACERARRGPKLDWVMRDKANTSDETGYGFWRGPTPSSRQRTYDGTHHHHACVQEGLEVSPSHVNVKSDDASVAGGKKVKPSKKSMVQATDSVAAFHLQAAEEGGVVGRAFPEISTAGGVKVSCRTL
jgi:hypothetical protein